MKKLATVLALFTLALTALPAQAEQYVSGRLGVYFPDESGFDNGFNLGLAYGLGFEDLLPQIPELRKVNAEFATGIYNAEHDNRFFGDVDLTVIPFTVSAIYNYSVQGSPLELYAGGGPGLYLAMIDTPGGDDSELEFGLHILGGGAFNIDRQLALFAELRGDLVTDDVGGTFLNLGVRYRF